MSAPAGKAFVTSGSCRAFVVVRFLRTAFVPPGTSQDPVPPDEIIAFGFPSRLEADTAKHEDRRHYIVPAGCLQALTRRSRF